MTHVPAARHLLRLLGPARAAALRARVGDISLRVATRATRRCYLPLEYPPSADPRPRWGYDRPPHARLRALIARHDPTYAEQLRMLAGYHDDLLAIAPTQPPTQPGEPYWRNPFLLGLDGVSLYGFVRQRNPARYVEVGSGHSTRFAARARRDGGLRTTITSIDPHPRADIDALCDDVRRSPLELADLGVFAALGAGDVVFVDGSHRAFMSSDATTFLLDVLPELGNGVLVGIHDVLLPDDYLPEWAQWHYSEQYLLAAYLLADGPWLHPVLACNHAAADPGLSAVLTPLFAAPSMAGVDPRGFTFWLEIGRPS